MRGPGALELLARATAADALWTHIGLSRGFVERGPVASVVLPVLGPLYWLLQFAVLLLVYALLSRVLGRYGLPGEVAASLAALGPTLAALGNMLLVLSSSLG